MVNAVIRVGRGGDSIRVLEDADDEWAWMRIHEQIASGNLPDFKVAVKGSDFGFVLKAPHGSTGTGDDSDEVSELQSQIVELWRSMGLHTSYYTAGSAVRFLQRLRILLGKDRGQSRPPFVSQARSA